MATRTRSGFGLHTDSLDSLHWAGIALSIVSGVIHLFLGVSFLPEPLGISFLLAGFGFLGAVVLVLTDVYRRAVYGVGVPFVAIQLVLWYYLNYVVGPKTLSQIGPIEIVDKVAQVALIAVLVVLLRRGT
jgi:hypothetical protein